MPNDLKKFREAGVDAFTGGFQVGAARTYKRQPQMWSNSQNEIKRILLTAFPRQATNPKQRERAGRWVRIIYLYYRLGYTSAQVAEELNMSKDNVRRMASNINRVRKGFKANNNKSRSERPAHRPKAVSHISGTTKPAKMAEDYAKDKGSHLHQAGESGVRIAGAGTSGEVLLPPASNVKEGNEDGRRRGS